MGVNIGTKKQIQRIARKHFLEICKSLGSNNLFLNKELKPKKYITNKNVFKKGHNVLINFVIPKILSNFVCSCLEYV